MNNLYKILLLALLLCICGLLAWSAFVAMRSTLPVCPVDAIRMQNGKAVIDAGRCIGCGRCVTGIPNPNNLSPLPAFQPEPAGNTIRPPIPADTDAPVKPDSAPSSLSVEPINSVAKKEPPRPDLTLVTTHWVDPSVCIGCRLCVSRCPENAIDFIGGKAVIDQAKCTNCGICVNGNNDDFTGCPVGAISKITAIPTP